MKKLRKPKSHSGKSLKPLKKSAKLQAPEPSPPATTTEPGLTDATAEFEKAVAHGASKIAAADEPRRGRGRPRKSVSPPERSDSTEPAGGGGTSIGSQLAPVQGHAPGTTAIIWKIGSKLAAKRTGFAEFECDADDCEALDTALIPVLNRYLPPSVVEASPLATFAITAVAIFGMKTIAYYDWKADQQKEFDKKSAEENNPKPIETSSPGRIL